MTTTGQLGRKEQEIMDFLHRSIFDAILQSPVASEKLKQGVRYTIMRMEQRDAEGMVQYYWSAIIGTERSIGFAAQMHREGFDRFGESIGQCSAEIRVAPWRIPPEPGSWTRRRQFSMLRQWSENPDRLPSDVLPRY